MTLFLAWVILTQINATPFGDAGRGKASRKIALPIMLLPLSGLLAGVKPRVKLLALSISYSWNPNEQLGNVFFRGPFNINKWSFLGTSKGDFGVKAPPQACQQNIFGILTATQINPRGQTCWPFSHE